ncbi:PAS domain-containing protein [Nannocystis pusilla]|uniref:PAS domain-containing protein n=1 Tax=Nannocystis pusilla TaxID=889268 RepID=UPI003B786047
MADRSDEGARAAEDGRSEPDPQVTLERVMALVNSSPSLVYLKDTEFRYTFINRTFGRDSNKTLADMYGRGDEVIMPPEFVAQVRADEIKVMESGEPLAYEEEVVTPKGRRHSGPSSCRSTATTGS